MDITITPGPVAGAVRIPGSKSHTIRALFVASLAEGTSHIRYPLSSDDTHSALAVCQALGAVVTEEDDEWRVRGTGSRPQVPENVIDVGNSGTTMRIAAGAAALAEGWTILTGDEQIRRRPVEPLIASLRELGSEAFTSRGNGCPPIVVRGPLKGGRTSIACPTSQFLTSLLMAAPLARGSSDIRVLELNEKPYVGITLGWLDSQGIRYRRWDWRRFVIEGNQKYRSFEKDIPGDYSSATFFLCAAAITGSRLVLEGLDRHDSQGDREVLKILGEMGCRIQESDTEVEIQGGELKGVTWDLNDIPDTLPSLAVVGCFAEGETRLLNVPQARIKETDRLATMRQELAKMGADVEELPDGLVVRKSALTGTRVEGHGDHRVAMSLAVAGLGAAGQTTVGSAEAADVTFPGFFTLLQKIRKTG